MRALYGAPLSAQSRKLLLLGSGELGKEMSIEAQRLGLEVIAVDAYENAPAMQVAHRSHVIPMTSGNDLRRVIEREKPDFIVPEVEAISTSTLLELETEGYVVAPTARAAHLTMNREGIRRLAAEELNLPTPSYAFADRVEDVRDAASHLGLPCVVKPIMSSSGKGQSVCYTIEDVETAWTYAMEHGRTRGSRVIVEGFVAFDAEITLLTVRTRTGTLICPPIGHRQKDGDYVESWQPHFLTQEQAQKAEDIARRITDALGGYGVFGVELYLVGEDVLFSEVSPRPHDTGLVTLCTQELSEFALHVRAIVGLPIPPIRLYSAGASAALKAPFESHAYRFTGVDEALASPNVGIRLFGKPCSRVGRRMGVVLAAGEDVSTARSIAMEAAHKIHILP